MRYASGGKKVVGGSGGKDQISKLKKSFFS